jgi:hypothetical protein
MNIVKSVFLRKIFINELNNCCNIFNKFNDFEKHKKNVNFFDPEKSNNQLYEELQKELLNKQNIEKIAVLLQKYYRYYIVDVNVTQKINSKKFLIAWAIVLFPEYTLEIKPDKTHINIYPHDIYFISKDFIETLSKTINTNESLRRFNKIFIQYVNSINYFLIYDKTRIIQRLLNEFINLHKSLDDIKTNKKYVKDIKETYIVETTKLKRVVANQLKKIHSNVTFEDLEVYSKIYCGVENTVTKNIKRAYYDLLLRDVQEKKFIFLGNIMDEITKYLNILGAEKIDESFNTKMDKEFLLQKMTHLKIEYKDIVDYGNYIVYIINKLESPINVINTNMKWEELIENIDDKYELLAKMMIFLFDEVRSIIDDINNLT